MFEYLYKNPKQISSVAKAEAADPDKIAMDVYPWEERLGAIGANDRVAIVDIGGSHGNALRQIKEHAPGLKGRLVLQDLEPVIREHEQALRADGIEPVIHDFFKDVQPISGKYMVAVTETKSTTVLIMRYLGAAVYYFRRIFHDWPDAPESKQILQNTVASMDRSSRILIHDIIVPEVGATMTHAWHDISVMAIGGIERTQKNFVRLLDSAGLELVKVWRDSGDMLGIVEARLK